MNIFSKVTLQSLKKNRTRTIVTIIGIILSTALICAVTTSIASVRQYAINYFEYTEGKWHGYEKASDVGMYNKIKSSDKVEGTGCLSYIGYADIDSINDYKPYLYICGFEQDMDGLIPVHIKDGRLPQNRNEILIPEHLQDNGGVSLKTGDQITLEIGDRKIDTEQIAEMGIDSEENAMYYSEDSLLTQQNPMTAVDSSDNVVLVGEHIEVKETRKFTVVGIYERPDFENYFAPGYTALTVPEGDDEFAEADIYYRMKNAKDIYDFKKDNGLVGETHSNVLMLIGVSRYDSFYRVVFGMAAIVIALIIFGSIMLIYNAFSISVAERTKQFGLLSSIGATKKQLKKMVRFEAWALSIIGIPLGILVGILGMWVTFLAIGNKFVAFSDNSYPEPMRICVSPFALIAACIIAFVTITISAWIPSKRATKISAVEAIRQNSDINQKKYIKTPKFIAKIFGLPGILAHKYFKCSKKKYRATIISLFMSIVLFVSAYAFTSYLVRAVQDTNETGGMDYSYHLFKQSESMEIDPEKVNDVIKNTEHITKSSYSLSDYIFFSADRKNFTEDTVQRGGVNESAYEKGKMNGFIDIIFVDDDTFRSFAEECGVNADEYMDKKSPKCIVYDCMLLFNSDTEKMERIRYFNGADFDMQINIFKNMDGYYFFEVNEDGKAVYVKKNANSINDETTMKVDMDEYSREITFHVGKIADKKPFFLEEGLLTAIFPYSMCEAFYGDLADESFITYRFNINSDDIYNGFASLKESLKGNGLPVDGLYNYADEVETERSMVLIVKVFAYGFIVLISLIAAANVFNTITTNINLRRREFAMLSSVGMTSKSMRKMLNFECIMYGAKALLYGLPASAGVTFLVYKAVNEGVDVDFYIPWRAVAIAVFSVFLVVFSTMMYSMSKIKKDNTIDALKNENL